MKARTKATAELFRPMRIPEDARYHIDVSTDLKHFTVEVWSDCNGRKQWPGFAATKVFERVPERKELAHGSTDFPTWELATTPYTVEIIRQLIPASQLLFTEDAKTVFDYTVANYQAHDRIAEAFAQFKESKSLPEHQLELHPDCPLSLYQQFACWAAMNVEGYGLLMEQGTGKTPVVVARVMNEAKRFQEATFDNEGLKLDAEKIRAKYRGMIANELAAIEATFEKKLEAERSHRENSAKLEAERRVVSLHHEGSVGVAIAKAKAVIQEAELWLTSRMASIKEEMKEFAIELRGKIDEAKANKKAELEIECANKVANLKPKMKAPEGRPFRAIIIVPKNVRLNWYQEFCKFATRPGNVTILRGGAIQRVACLTEAFQFDEDTQYTVVIATYEALWKSWQVLSAIDWDLAVLDEGHYIKSRGAKRSQFAKKLRDNSRRRMLLTGTPVTNSPLDLYTQLEFLGQGYSGFTTWESFKDFYGVFDTTGSGYDKLVGMQNLPFMQERLTECCFMIRKEEALPDLPDKVYDVTEVQMTAEQAEYYDKIATELALEIEQDLERGGENRLLLVQNILVKLLRLAQITSGFISWDPIIDPDSEVVVQPRRIEYFKDSPKIQALLELLKDKTPDQKTIIWACFIPDIRAIEAALKANGIDCVTFYGGTSDKDRDEAVRRFNEDPTCKVFIGHPAAGGVGLNLLGYPPGNGDDYTTNCDHEIYYSQGWSMVHRAQSEDRAHRRGTRTNIRITDLTVPNTVDELIRERVFEKRQVALQVADVREILSSILKGIGRHDD